MELLASAQERLEELRARVLEAPKDSETAISLGEAFLREGRVEDAAEEYARATRLDPRGELKSLYWEWLGLVRESRGELESALDAYFQWLESDHSTVEPLDRLGTLLVTLGRWTDVVLLKPHYALRGQHLTDLKVKESVALYAFVLEQLGHSQEKTPSDLAYAALELDAESIPMRYLLGILFYRIGHFESARGEFERVLELDLEETWVERRFSLMWDAATARIMLAKIARIQGYPHEALHRLSESFSLHDENSEGLFEVASVLLDYGHYTDLLDILPSEDPVALNLEQVRAECYLGLGQIERAEEGFRRVEVLELEESSETAPLTPKQSESLSKARKLLEEQAYEEVLEALKRVGNKKRPVSEALDLKAQALVALKRWSRAVDVLEELVVLGPDDPATWARLRDGYLHTGQTLRYRLAALQHEKLSSLAAPEVGIAWPTSDSSGLAGMVFQARALPGQGRLVVTGDLKEGVRELGELALTLLRTDFERMNLEDPSFRDLHLHSRAVWLEQEEKADLSEDAGAAVLATLGLALSDRFPERLVLVSGRLDLAGTLRGPLDLDDGLPRLAGTGLVWEAVAVPRACSPELLRVPPTLGLTCELYLVDSARELIQKLGESV